jgi:hypothetical protein
MRLQEAEMPPYPGLMEGLRLTVSGTHVPGYLMTPPDGGSGLQI